MTESRYAHHVLVEPKGTIERDGKVIFDGLFAQPEKLGTKCQLLYSIVTKAHVNEETPHIHDFPIILSFIGTNPDNICDFDAEIEFYLGGEKQIITTMATVSVPPGLSHCPLIFKRVSKPIAFMEVQLTDKYERREVAD
jgi:hypothetical protein